MHRRQFLASLAAAALPLGSPLRAAEVGDRPNLLLIQADDLAPDDLGLLGAPVNTPNLDALAARGATFRHAVCQGVICVPARNALLAGRYPHQTGIYGNSDGPMPADTWCFPRALAAAGYDTAYFGKSHFHLNVPGEFTPGDDRDAVLAAAGFAHVHATSGKATIGADARTRAGRDPYWDYLRRRGLLAKLQEDARARRDAHPLQTVAPSPLEADDGQDAYIARQAAAWLRQRDGASPFFAWIGFVAPHPPADAPEPYFSMHDPAAMRLPRVTEPERADPRTRELMGGVSEDAWRRYRAAYYGMIAYLDAQVGRIVDTLRRTGQLERTLIVFTADQGTMLGDHGQWGKGGFYREAISAPLLVAGPGVTAGTRVDRPVEMLDLVPTLLEAAQAPAEDRAPAHGESLRPLLANRDGYRRDACFAEHAEAQMIVAEAHKLVRDASGPKQLFDLGADPGEAVNLVREQPGLAEELSRRIDAWQAATPPVLPPNPRGKRA